MHLLAPINVQFSIPFSQFFPFFPIHAYNFRFDFSLIFFNVSPKFQIWRMRKTAVGKEFRKKIFWLNRYIYDKLTLGTQVIREKSSLSHAVFLGQLPSRFIKESLVASHSLEILYNCIMWLKQTTIKSLEFYERKSKINSLYLHLIFKPIARKNPLN